MSHTVWTGTDLFHPALLVAFLRSPVQ